MSEIVESTYFHCDSTVFHSVPVLIGQSVEDRWIRWLSVRDVYLILSTLTPVPENDRIKSPFAPIHASHSCTLRTSPSPIQLSLKYSNTLSSYLTGGDAQMDNGKGSIISSTGVTMMINALDGRKKEKRKQFARYSYWKLLESPDSWFCS